MSRGSAAEAQVVSGDQTTETADDETPNKEELEIAWRIASRKTSKSKFTKIRNRIISLLEDASASCLLKADARVTQLDQWLDKLFDEALEVKSAVARYLDNHSSSRNSSVRSSKKSATVKSKISKSTDKQQSARISRRREERKSIRKKTAASGKSKPDNYRDTVDWVESQQNIRATTNERSQLNSNSDSVEKEIRQLEEEIKTIRAARQAVSDLQMPVMTNRQTNVELSRSTRADEGNSNKLSNHLERIHLPTFSGDKTKFEEWKARFTVCVDKTDASTMHKLIRLRSLLRGEAEELLEDLGWESSDYYSA
ncbi:Hypothetical predicted protein [Paramuricea clavata]|uniref:Uncharacterized protein n=1 Tax=Paramuricea clavata TaxID=317549 RepID=A0A6S7GJH5_PARCT|nr:Hypothetical predicted protein [Paramuricea clavata]